MIKEDSMSNRNDSSDSLPGCIIFLILGAIALPLIGLYYILSGGSDDRKALGWVLFIAGCILWLCALTYRG